MKPIAKWKDRQKLYKTYADCVVAAECPECKAFALLITGLTISAGDEEQWTVDLRCRDCAADVTVDMRCYDFDYSIRGRVITRGCSPRKAAKELRLAALDYISAVASPPCQSGCECRLCLTYKRWWEADDAYLAAVKEAEEDCRE